MITWATLQSYVTLLCTIYCQLSLQQHLVIAILRQYLAINQNKLSPIFSLVYGHVYFCFGTQPQLYISKVVSYFMSSWSLAKAPQL